MFRRTDSTSIVPLNVCTVQRQRFDPTNPEMATGLAPSSKRKHASLLDGGSGKSSRDTDGPGELLEKIEDEEEEKYETEEDVVVGELDPLELVVGTGTGTGPISDVCIVVDSGFSFTHILPFYQGRALHKSVRALLSFRFHRCIRLFLFDLILECIRVCD